MTDKPVVLTASMASNLLRLLDADADLYGAQALRDLAAGRTLCVSAEIVARERDGFACSEITLRALRANTEGWTPLYRAQEDGNG